MQQEKDYIKREVEKVILFIKRLLDKTPNIDLEDVLNSEEISSALSFNLKRIVLISVENFNSKVKDLDPSILEQLVKLFLKLANKETENKTTHLKKALILLELIDKKDKVFSIERRTLKQKLERLVPRETNN